MLLKFKKIVFNLVYILLFSFLWISSYSVSYSEYLYNVSIDSIYINSFRLDEYYDIVLSNKDSIRFNFTLEGFTQNSSSTYMYKVVLKNSQGDSAIKTMGISNCLYANLNEDKYEISISAFDVKGKWVTAPEIIKFEVDNKKANLIAENRQLTEEKRTSDSLIALFKDGKLRSSHNSNLFGIPFLLEGIAAIIIIVLIIILIISYRRNKKSSKKISEFQTQLALKDQMLDSQNVRTDDLMHLKQNLEGTMTEINSKVDEIMYVNEAILYQVDLMRHKNFEMQQLQENKNVVFSDILARGIKEPAASIKSLVELLRSYDLNVNDTKDIVKYIIEATQKIIAISEDIQRTSDVNMIERVNLNCENVKVQHLLEEALASSQEEALEKRINIKHNIEAGIDVIYVDYEKIFFVLHGLVANAVRNTYNTGNIMVSCYYNEAKNGVIFEVKDDGIGLNEEELQYFSLDKSQNTANTPSSLEDLAFAKIKHYIEAHNGLFQVSSTLGKGTTFTFLLPIN